MHHPRLAAMALALVLLACRTTPDAAPAPAPTPSDLANGAHLYRSYCASCHGVGGRGDGPVAVSLAKPPADLTQLGVRYGTPLPVDRLAEWIDGRRAVAAHGPREMPVWGTELYRSGPDVLPPGHPNVQARESARRGTVLLILDYLQTLQPPQPPG